MLVFETSEPLQISSRDVRIFCVIVYLRWWIKYEADLHDTQSATTHEHDHVTQITHSLDLADTVKTIINTMLHYGVFPLSETRALVEREDVIHCWIDIEIGGKHSVMTLFSRVNTTLTASSS